MSSPPDNDRPPPANDPPPEPSLSDLLRSGSGSSQRPRSSADVFAQLDKLGNTDDAPTIITTGKVADGSGSDRNAPSALPSSLPLSSATATPGVAGRRLGHFELIEAIGSGGMAAVLKARDLELGRIVALKILPPESTRDAENVTRFKSEARAAAKLDHENVARVYFCGEDQGLHFIAFEFVEGETLRARIDKRGTLPGGECVKFMIQIAAGLNHAAERGVVHRDIKPSNIIITPDGRAKIVDMGLARHLDANSVNGGVTQSGVTLGTFDYISPEQALDPRRADVRSDIYSLGCTFYHALTGRPPVPEGTAAKKLRAHQQIPPLDPRVLNPAVPDELAAVVGRMMVKNPDHRYQTPAELIAQLKGVAAKLHLSTDSVSTDSVVRGVAADPRVLPEPPKVRAAWVVAAVAVAVAVTVIVAAQSGRTPPPPPPWADGGKRDDGGAPITGGGTPTAGTPQPGPDGVVHVKTADDLAKVLGDATTTRVKLDRGLYDLTRLPTAVAFAGKELELVGSVTAPVRVRVHAAADGAPGSLSLTATGTVAVTGVRFDLVAPPDDFDIDIGLADAAGVRITAAEARLADCVFVPDEKFRAHGPSVVVGGDAGKVRLDRCLFAPGRVGVQVPAKADVTVEDSGFGPHSAALAVKAGDTAPAAIRLTRSSFMLDANAAAVEAESPVRVTAGHCVFAAATAAVAAPLPETLPVRGVVVRERGEKLTADTFAGVADQKNAYYRVNPIAHATEDASKSYTFDEAKALSPVPADDRGAVLLKQRPWDVENIPTQLTGPDPFRAFRLKLTDRGVFAEGVVLLGAQFHLPGSPTRRAYTGSGFSAWPPPKPAATPEVRQLVWSPSTPLADVVPGRYSDIVKLMRDVRSGDEVLIDHDGPLPVDTTRIESAARPGPDRGDFRVTIRPSPGRKPVLTATDTNRDLDATLFRLMDGEATFENLQFQIKAKSRDHRSQAVVTLVSAKGCVFRGCVFTLDEDESKAAAAVLADAEREMRMDPGTPRPTPKLRFENCLVRGKGRGLWVPVSRPFELDVSNTVTATEGEFVLSEPAGKEPLGAARSAVKFTRVTALVGGPLVEMRGAKIGEMKAAGLVPIDVEVESSLFAAVPGSPKPLVELEGIDPTDVERVLTWKSGRNVRYANFDAAAQFAVIRPGDEAGTTKTWDRNQWLGFSRDAGNPVGKVIFASGPTGLKDLASLRAADVRVAAVDFPDLDGAKAEDAGVDPRDVPRPTADEE